MLLEDFVGELDKPIWSLDILENVIELTIEEEMRYSEETKKLSALLYTLRCVIYSLKELHKKYNNIIDEEYEKMKASTCDILL